MRNDTTTTGNTVPVSPSLPVPFGAFRAAVRHAYNFGPVPNNGKTLPPVPSGQLIVYVLRTTRTGGVSYHPLAALPAALRASIVDSLIGFAPVAGYRLFTDENPTRDGIDSGRFAELGALHSDAYGILADTGYISTTRAAALAKRDLTYPGYGKYATGHGAIILPRRIDSADDNDARPGTTDGETAQRATTSEPVAPIVASAEPEPVATTIVSAADIQRVIDATVITIDPTPDTVLDSETVAPTAEPVAAEPEPEPTPAPRTRKPRAGKRVNK